MNGKINIKTIKVRRSKDRVWHVVYRLDCGYGILSEEIVYDCVSFWAARRFARDLRKFLRKQK